MTLEDAVKETGTYYCLECSKCSSLCPVARYDPGFSPRVFVEDALLGKKEDLIDNRDLFSCLTCNSCSDKCPAGVDFPSFVRKLRTMAGDAGHHGDCSHAGILQSLMRLMANPRIRQNRLDWLTDSGCRVRETGEVLFFTGCSPYFEPVFEDIGVRTLDIAQGSVSILNALGIEPAVLPEEKCCGHDLLWTGDEATFLKLAEHNVEAIRQTGAKTIVFSCPECLKTFTEDYRERFGIDCEMVHISEYLADTIGSLKLKPLDMKVTYQDPCRLGRHLGIYDAPRKVLESIPGIELTEMPRNRDNAVCCGTSAWTNCDVGSRQIREDRLEEASRTGAAAMVTSCPKCLTHFRCTRSGQQEEGRNATDLTVIDLVELVTKALQQ